MTIKKSLLTAGALLMLALIILTSTRRPDLAHFMWSAAAIMAALGMAAMGVAAFPRSRSKRLIVRRDIMLGASACLLAASFAVLWTVLDANALLAAAFVHHAAAGGSVLMAIGPVALSEEQAREFAKALSDLKGYYPQLSAKLDEMVKGYTDQQRQINELRRARIAGGSDGGIRWVGNVPFVTEDCAKALTSVMVMGLVRHTGALEGMVPDEEKRKRIIDLASTTLGMQVRAALTTTEIPVPNVYVPQIVELVYKYGQARQYATVFPLGAGTVKLPRLKAGEDDFGYLGAGTAGMSQSVTEKKVTAELVTFTANKAGGLIRIPVELQEDTFIPIGQFLARYIARQFAKLEDKTLFLADGTGTFANQTGIGPYCSANSTYLLQLASTKTKPSDSTLDDWRNLRSKVSPAILAGGFDAAYYINPTFEPFLRSFNQYPNFVVFSNENGKPTFDGWPVRWVGVSQAYATTATPSAYLGFFGALSYWYLGERGQPRVETSLDVFFQTDEIAMRALERFDVEAMAIDAMAALQTAAS